MATEPLYERILGRVEREALHRSCNSVLQDDVSALQQAVSEVVATFAKVEELRDAVKRLERGMPSTGRSASLMKTMGDTIKLQRELEGALEKVEMGMSTRSETGASREAEHKRKRSSSTSGRSTEEEEEKVKLNKKKRQIQAGSEVDKERQDELQSLTQMPTETNDLRLDLARKCYTTISKVKTANKKIQFDMKTGWSKAVIDIKGILKQLACTENTSADNEVIVQALSSAASIFKQLEWTPEHLYEVQSLVAALAGACSKNATLTKVFSRVRATLDELQAGSVRSMAARKDKELLDRLIWTYRGLVENRRALPDSEKPQRIAETLSMLETVMSVYSECNYVQDVRDAVELVECWCSTISFSDYHCSKIRDFAIQAELYITRMKINDTQLHRRVAGIHHLVLLYNNAEGSNKKQGRTPMRR